MKKFLCRCTYCRLVMSSKELSEHDCPHKVLPRDDESFECYQNRIKKLSTSEQSLMDEAFIILEHDILVDNDD